MSKFMCIKFIKSIIWDLKTFHSIPNQKILKGFFITSKQNFSTRVENSSHTSTIDKKEIDLLTSFKNEWWCANGAMKALHSLNTLRVPFIRDGLLEINDHLKNYINGPSPLKGVKILEIGCGGGILSEPLAKLGGDITGIDASKELILLAKEHTPHLDINLNYLNDTIEDYSLNHQNEFDAVIASEVIEHITNKILFLEHCIKTLRPGGSLFITTMNKTNIAWLGGIILAENILKILPVGTHDWEKFVSPEDISRIISKCV